jgi:hypothetical protein
MSERHAIGQLPPNEAAPHGSSTSLNANRFMNT